MRKKFIESYGTITGVKPALLKNIFQNVTDDAIPPTKRKLMIEYLNASREDDTLVWDLRVNNDGRPEKYLDFLEQCQSYIQTSIETSVSDRRHDTVVDGDVVTHLATALNAPNLHNEVAKRCPDGTPIPFVQWLRWQFWPRHTRKSSAKRYSGRIKVKYMVMARQFRAEHIDSHYASAIWRYEKQFCLKYREFTKLVLPRR